MNGHYAQARNFAVFAGAALCLIATSNNIALAQRSSPASVQRRVEQLNRQGEQYDRDELARDARGNSSSDQRRTQALAEQVKHDFEGLQASYNEIVIAVKSSKSIDYRAISGSIADIRKYSSRLKTNLALPQLKDEQNKKAEGTVKEQAEDPLLSLQQHIYNFLTNPLFEARALLDVEQAKKASRDLDKVIELSENLRKKTEQSRNPED